MNEGPIVPPPPAKRLQAIFNGSTIPGQILSAVLGAAATAVIGYAVTQLAGGWLIHQLGGVTKTDFSTLFAEEFNKRPPTPTLLKALTWEKDVTANGELFDTNCEYRVKITTPSSGDSAFSDGSPQLIYATWIKPWGLLHTYKSGMFIVNFKNRQKITLPEPQGSTAEVALERRCP